MATEIEGLKMKGISINDLLLPEFIEELEKHKVNINAVSLVFVGEEEKDEKKKIIPFVINHQNSEEVREKIVHLSGSNEKDLKKISAIIRKTKK